MSDVTILKIIHINSKTIENDWKMPKTNDYYIVACKHYIIEYGFLVHDGHCLITKLSSVVSAEMEIKGEKIGEKV